MAHSRLRAPKMRSMRSGCLSKSFRKCRNKTLKYQLNQQKWILRNRYLVKMELKIGGNWSIWPTKTKSTLTKYTPQKMIQISPKGCSHWRKLSRLRFCHMWKIYTREIIKKLIDHFWIRYVNFLNIKFSFFKGAKMDSSEKGNPKLAGWLGRKCLSVKLQRAHISWRNPDLSEKPT